jgi:hypothetical protein
MKRSLAVTLSAILSLLGSALTLALGVLLIFILFFFAPTRANFSGVTAAPKVIFVMGALVYILPAIWGIITSVGLFCLKNWARISIIVFSVILILTGAFAGLLVLLVPLPAAPNQATSQSAVTVVRGAMAAFWFGLAGIGTWWLILFTRPKVKEQFTALPPAYAVPGAPQIPQTDIPGIVGQVPANNRPLSITILGWLLLVGCAFIPINFLIHTPAILLTRVITGHAATFYFLFLLVLHFYLGIGLLRLNATARTVGIAYYMVAFANAAIFYLSPGSRERMMSLVSGPQAMWPWMRQFQQPGPQLNPMPFMVFGGVVGLLFLLIPLYFLITRRQAFAVTKEAPAI